MMFLHTHELVMAGTKTQTRRVKFPFALWQKLHKHSWTATREQRGNDDISDEQIAQANTILERVEITLPVIPNYRAKSIGRIRVKSIRREDVRGINDLDVRAEGFNSRAEFLQLWSQMHNAQYQAYVIEFKLI